MTAVRDQEPRSGLPLIRLTLVAPFTSELDKRGIDVDAILGQFDLTRENLHSPDVFVTAAVMYQLLEAMAASAEDPYLAVYIGETLDVYGWPVFSEAARDASSFGEFFFRFSKEAGNQATSVKMRLETDGEYATFRAYRVSEPGSCPGQADAFYVGLFGTIFQRCAGDAWDPSKVTVRICDTSVIPKNYKNVIVTQGDRRGCSIRFPQEWLLLPFNLEDFRQRVIPKVNYQLPPKSLVGAIHQALLPHIHLPDLDVDHAAELCGYDKRTLGRKLKAKGTSISKEIARLKEQQATRALIETKRSISDISNSVGFNDSSVFSRAFKKWTGFSPSEYRRHNKIT